MYADILAQVRAQSGHHLAQRLGRCGNQHRVAISQSGGIGGRDDRGFQRHARQSAVVLMAARNGGSGDGVAHPQRHLSAD
jgi:hypothetical protein